jgi:hypothetical protein
LPYAPQKIGHTIYNCTIIPSILLSFFLVAEMDIPSALNHAIRFSVPPHQRTTFDRAVAGLPTDFLSYPVTREVLGV